MLPSLESLRCFVAAARVLNFRNAAASLALTPAAVGQRIKQLEDELGAALFVRTTRSMQLTAAGLALVPRAEACLMAAAACFEVGDANVAMPPMDLLLGTRHELGISWILPQLDGLRARFPSVKLHLYVGSGPDLLLRVRTLEVDCAITSSAVTEERLDALPLHREEYVFVASPRLLAQTPFRKPGDAGKHELVDVNAQRSLFRYFADAEARPGDFAFKSFLRLGTIEAVRQRIVGGAGVGVLPKYLVEPDLRARRLVRLFTKVNLRDDCFRLVFRTDDPRRPLFDRLASAMREAPLR
jgi:DNA-binding transcriptional LysR family regulator